MSAIPAASVLSRLSRAAGSGTVPGPGRVAFSARAPPRRHAVSMCSRSRSASRAGSLPVVDATRHSSPRRLSGSAMRALRSLRGLAAHAARVLGLREDAVGDQVAVHAPERADQVLGGAASSAGVPALYGACPDLLGELADLQRGGLVDPPVSPFPDYFGPVRAVDAPGSRGDYLLHKRYVVGDQRDLGPWPGLPSGRRA